MSEIRGARRSSPGTTEFVTAGIAGALALLTLLARVTVFGSANDAATTLTGLGAAVVLAAVAVWMLFRGTAKRREGEANPTADPGDYRLSTRTVLVIGSLAAVVGLVAWILGGIAGPIVGLLGFVVFAIGLPVLISGLVRESRENKAKRAART